MTGDHFFPYQIWRGREVEAGASEAQKDNIIASKTLKT